MNFKPTMPAPNYTGPILDLSKYTAALAPTPPKVYWEYKIPAGLWGMLGNNQVGDCEIARIAHMLMLFTAHTGTMVVPTLDEVMAVYSAISGYDGTEATDTGCATPDVLNYWQNTGISGHKIVAWGTLPMTQDGVEQGVYLFGCAALDIAVYQSMMDQTNGRQPWDDPAGDLLGYHAVPAEGYGRDGVTVITWGALQQMGWPTTTQVLQGNYAVITQDWIDQATAKTPSGFDLATLQEDLKALQA